MTENCYDSLDEFFLAEKYEKVTPKVDRKSVTIEAGQFFSKHGCYSIEMALAQKIDQLEFYEYLLKNKAAYLGWFDKLLGQEIELVGFSAKINDLLITSQEKKLSWFRECFEILITDFGSNDEPFKHFENLAYDSLRLHLFLCVLCDVSSRSKYQSPFEVVENYNNFSLEDLVPHLLLKILPEECNFLFVDLETIFEFVISSEKGPQIISNFRDLLEKEVFHNLHLLSVQFDNRKINNYEKYLDCDFNMKQLLPMIGLLWKTDEAFANHSENLTKAKERCKYLYEHCICLSKSLVGLLLAFARIFKFKQAEMIYELCEYNRHFLVESLFSSLTLIKRKPELSYLDLHASEVFIYLEKCGYSVEFSKLSIEDFVYRYWMKAKDYTIRADKKRAERFQHFYVLMFLNEKSL